MQKINCKCGLIAKILTFFINPNLFYCIDSFIKHVHLNVHLTFRNHQIDTHFRDSNDSSNLLFGNCGEDEMNLCSVTDGIIITGLKKVKHRIKSARRKKREFGILIAGSEI